MERLIVIGGVAAGLSAASAAKKLKKDSMDVTVFEKTGYVSYGACSEPYYISGIVPNPDDLIEVTPEDLEKKRKMHVFRRHEVVKVEYDKGMLDVLDIDRGVVSTHPFDYLVITTGAIAKRLGVKGEGMNGICTLRTVEDATKIKASASSAEQVAICGGGYIGLEMAEAFRHMGKEVTVLKKTAQMLMNFDPKMSSIVEEEVRSKGVKIITGVDILSFEGDNRVQQVITSEGAIPAQTVLISKGAVPNTSLALSFGVKTGKTGAIEVDLHQKTNLDRVYAAGDCAEAHHLILDGPAYIPLGTTANKTGRVAGENIGGLDTGFWGIVGTGVSKIFDLEVARTGLSLDEAQKNGLDAYATTITHGSRSGHYPGGSPLYVHLVTQSGTRKLLGAQIVGREGAALRINTLAAALHAGMSVDDLYHLDMGYAPPFAPVWDAVLIAANKARKG
ncbi:MAG: FAD-dependent oxidoreductase [Thermodesulfobacteriota bacterium]|nr:FAD-dependent oxidoreductase [Thermodesulfobacteriota bacterium]